MKAQFELAMSFGVGVLAAGGATYHLQEELKALRDGYVFQWLCDPLTRVAA